LGLGRSRRVRAASRESRKYCFQGGIAALEKK
jgi:hypothetical protein